MIVLDKLGWPVETVAGRPILNTLRRLIHGRVIITDDAWDTIQKNLNNRQSPDGTTTEQRNDDGNT